jgi:hypothetical protein
MMAAVFLAIFSDEPAAMAAAPAIQVWFSPGAQTPDLLDMFRQPELWSKARSQISVLKFGPAQFGGAKVQLAAAHALGINTIADLSKVNAFQLLRSWNISLALEAPAIKPWDCTGRAAAKYTLQLIENARAAGGIVRYASMDEPLASGMRFCGDTLETAAAKTAAYIKQLKASDPALEVGDIEAYPWDHPVQLEQWLIALTRNGAKPAHFHLDVNVHFLDVHPEVDAAGDLRSLKAFAAAQGIPFGIIFWSGYNPEPTDQAYFDRTMAWVRRVHAAIGAPEQAIFQSWVVRSYPGCADTDPRCFPPKLKCPPSDTSGCGLGTVPVNLPEGDPKVFSHTRLVNEALGVLR